MSDRRLSTSSSDSGSSYSSPILSNVDSSTALVLVPDDEESIRFDFTSDDDDEDYSDDQFPAYKTSPSIPPLPPTSIFIYLLSPYLKLGALLLPNVNLPLKYGILTLAFFAILSAFVRQIWYMMARYLKKVDMEEIILDAFARGRGRERRREFLRAVIRSGTACIRISLAAVYLRESITPLLPFFPATIFFSARVSLTFIVTILVLPLSLAPSLASKRMLYATWISIATYLIWLGCASYAHARGTLEINTSWLEMGSLWQGISTIAFAFTSNNTLPLYASLKATTRTGGISTAKTPKSQSFRTLSLTSVAVAFLSVLPLIFFSSAPNPPETSNRPPNPLLPTLTFLTLLLAIPPLLPTVASFPLIPSRLRHSLPAYTTSLLLHVPIILLSLLPLSAFQFLTDLLLLLAFLATYFLPALIHITTHNFKRPLSIVIPSLSGTAPSTPREDSAGADELLQRKERSLQRKQWRKRLVWDVGVWVLLVPVGGGGLAWSFGKWMGVW